MTRANRLVTDWQDTTRIIFDVHANISEQITVRLMEFADRAVYFVPTSGSDAAIRRLQGLDVPARGGRDKIRIAWLLGSGDPVAPVVPNLREFACRDFKIAEPPPGLPWGRSLAGGLERLVHDLRGVRIGVALGGGAARGKAHLGVLKALEQNGIVVDMIAGTSAGAMTGVVYASGLDADYSAERFSKDLRPSWFFRHLLRGDHWYLLYKYRRGQFDPMLRPYLHDWKLEQLAIPCLSVSGCSVVRERGDAVHAILESINLPVLSVPIVRGGQALIDGGLVNNIPADVLVAMGCNFVIAVSVTAKLEKAFSGITPGTTTTSGKKPGFVQTLMRSLMVQDHSLNAIGVQPADIVIEPDVRAFEMTDFVRTNDPTTAVLALDQIHHLLMHVGKRRLDAGQTRNAEGILRLCYGTPDWPDFVSLAVTEIRHFGASSMQVARRLQAMIEHLLRVLPEARKPALQQELNMLQRAIQRSFPDEEDRARCQVGDFQGIGSSES